MIFLFLYTTLADLEPEPKLLLNMLALAPATAPAKSFSSLWLWLSPTLAVRAVKHYFGDIKNTKFCRPLSLKNFKAINLVLYQILS
jgi:hypothetical protein